MNIYIGTYSRLPSAYQEVEYIQSTGTQFLAIGNSFSTDYKVEIDVQLTATGGDQLLFGCATGGANSVRFGINAYGSYFKTITGGSSWSNTKSEDANRHTFIMDKGTTYVDGTSYSSSYVSYTYNFGLGLFVYNRIDGGERFSAKEKLFSCKIYNGSTILYDLVPCYRKSDNAIGMYDLVNNQFYTNSGTGIFAKGADVYTNVLKNIYIGEYGWKPLNPKCWYKFDGDYTDATGTYGVASGTSTFQTLSSGVKVLQTDGSNMVSLPNEITANSLSTYTIIFWMKPITTSPTYGYYAGCGNTNGTHISFYENTSGRDFVEWYNGSRDLTTSGVGAGWRLVCFRSNGSNCDLIVNGSNKTSTTTAPSIFGYSSYNTFVLGARNMIESGTGQRTSVQISNFVISNTYWDDATCLDMYNQTKSNYGL